MIWQYIKIHYSLIQVLKNTHLQLIFCFVDYFSPVRYENLHETLPTNKFCSSDCQVVTCLILNSWFFLHKFLWNFVIVCHDVSVVFSVTFFAHLFSLVTCSFRTDLFHWKQTIGWCFSIQIGMLQCKYVSFWIFINYVLGYNGKLKLVKACIESTN